MEHNVMSQSAAKFRSGSDLWPRFRLVAVGFVLIIGLGQNAFAEGGGAQPAIGRVTTSEPIDLTPIANDAT